MLINYVAPEVIGFTNGVNQFVADYVKENPRRLLSCGSLHPKHTTNVLADVEQILRLGLQMIKIHPPHQLLFPNDYLRASQGTGDYLPRGGSQWCSGHVPHGDIDFSWRAQQVW
jgi:predicted TIM-barrel fold metal-dependent hydrolase